MATPAAAPPVDNAAAVQAPAADAARRAGGVVSTGADWFAMIPQIALMLAMYYTFATPPKPPGSRAAGAAGGAQGAVNGGSLGGSSALSGGDPAGQALSQGHPMAAPGGIPPLWPVGTEFEIYVYLTGSNETSRGVVMADDGVVPTAAAPGTAGLPDPLDIQGKGPLILYEEGLKLDSSLASNARNLEMNLTRTDIPDAWNNKTVFLHMFAARNRADPMMSLGTSDVVHRVSALIHWEKRAKAKKTVNLISGELSEKDKAINENNAMLNVTEEGVDDFIPVWKSEFYLDIVEEVSTWPAGGIPPPILQNFRFITEGGIKFYLPIVHINEFWLTKKEMVLVNESVAELPLKLHVRCEGKFKWLMIIQWEASMKQQQSMGTQTDKDQDLIKTVLLDTNPVLLGVTMTVSMLHTVFDFLAFKNDISFWRKVETMQGLSIRSIFTSIITQAIVFLYLLDNDTSWVILFSSGIGLMIECWKVNKAMDIEILPAFPFVRLKHKQSYKSETLKYDKLAMNYLSYVLYPLSLGFSIYSLCYNTYKSWWSWLISSLVGCVYTFGFIMMTPQLFINYKLKSVAHLPWRAMVYKFLNTIIDDLFAFVIKMPTLHKLSVFRDDLIFVIYIYQRWAYRVDRARVNEYGLVAKDMEDMDQEGKDKAADGVPGGDATSRPAIAPAAP